MKKIFGTANNRLVKRYQKIVNQINQLEPAYVALSDDALRAKTSEFKMRLQNGESLEAVKVEAFATVREASKRALKMRHFDVQLIGGLVMHDGKIAEMKTGEGKTLVATVPMYLNALAGKGAHLVTINDYLAKRDAEWMGKLYDFLGLSVGYIIHGLTDAQRRQAYHADITYGTNHEFGFDYLRDNMKFHIDDMVMRPFHYAIVDEVDSILVDEARTPLIISGPAEKSSDLYLEADKVIKQLSEEHYEKDEKHKNITFTDAGVEHTESLLAQADLIKTGNLYDVENVNLLHHINAALKANIMYNKDRDYIVKDQQIIIIDEFTGRMMEGRRYSEGLHQAIEAKENVPIQIENQTLASITYQNYFRMYPKLAGMSGTVMTEAEEFEEIYRLQSVSIPTNQPVTRQDHNDKFYVSADEKYDAVIKLIQKCLEKKQPVLVGTTSIEKSEYLSHKLKNADIKHNVLNARYHEEEALIIANAGKLSAVTIATNMAGRGTDIQLGGNLSVSIAEATKGLTSEHDEEKQAIIDRVTQEIQEEHDKVLAAGGLYIIGTERHESRRIDNQLRGRSGRQGDPGESQFLLCSEDDLLRIFGFDQKQAYLRRNIKPGENVSHWWLNKTIAGAQRKVEARNFDTRKHLLKYDDVMNDQRKIVYAQRKELMQSDDLTGTINGIRDQVLADLIEVYLLDNTSSDTWNTEEFESELHRLFSLTLPLKTWVDEDLSKELIEQNLYDAVDRFFDERYAQASAELRHFSEKTILLQLLDQHWKDHLYYLDQLRQGINLRAYAQSNPLNEYKREAFNAFQTMLRNLRNESIAIMCRMPIDHLMSENTSHAMLDAAQLNMIYGNTEDESFHKSADKDPVLSRNAACFCGSGKRYKHCHGAL